MEGRPSAIHDAERRARVRANHRVAFLGHLVVYGATILLLAVIFVPAAVIVALSWGIGLAAHGFFAVAAPVLRERWVADELRRVLPAVRTTERRASRDEHARETSRLAASLAHEIRNPIAAAKSLVQQIAEDPAGADAKEYAAVAQSELDRVERSIAHLLRFAREEPLRAREVDLREIVDAAVRAAAERTAGVRVERSIASAAIEADDDKVRRAVLNLVSNAADAVRALPEERREIAIEGGPSFDGGSVWIRVRDRGTGIDAAIRERVFDPWVTGRESGNGLGLPIARKLCEAHGGSLEIEHSGPEGTSMLITLPRESGAPA